MLLTPANREQLVRQIERLPPEKRRVVVLVGRHPNEGTINIGVRHHRTWEEHGAVTVRLPAAWTPPGFWKNIERSRASRTSAVDETLVANLQRRVPRDEDIIALLERHKISVPVVNLHGTGGRRLGLDIIPYRHAPRWLYDAMRSAVRGQPRDFSIKRKTTRGSIAAHPLEVLIEFNFEGRRRSKSALEEAVSALLLQHKQLTPVYLSGHAVKREELEKFDALYASKLTWLIRQLSMASENEGRA